MAFDGAPPPDDTPWPDDAEEDAQQVRPLSLDDMDGGPIPLGYDRDNRNYYLSRQRGTIICLTAPQHNEANLCNLAPLDWYRSHFRSKKGVPWKMVAETLYRFTDEAGIYNVERIRGRGVHIDEGHIVLHLGNKIQSEGRTFLPGISPVQGSEAIYCAGHSLKMPDATPLTNAEAARFFDLVDECSWQTSDMGPLMAGWAVVSPFCGAMPFRPYLWLTGVSGSGKNWIMNNLIKPVLANFLVCSTLDTTAAGARRHLKLDALPFWINEAESETEKSAEAIAAIIRLARSSSDGDAMTIMGDGVNGASNVFMTRSMFLFSSTVHSLSATADINRTVQVALEKNADTGWFKDYQKRVRAAITPDYGARFLARGYKLLPVILDNISVLSEALSDELVDSRIADTLSPMLAGYASLKSQKRLTIEQAVDLVKSRDWVRRAAMAVQDQATAEHEKVLNYLMTRVLDVVPGVRRSIGELLTQIHTHNTTLDTEPLLLRHGIRTSLENEWMEVWFARAHPNLNRMFANTAWSDGRWSRVLKQHPRCVQIANKRFGVGGSPYQTLMIHWAEINGKDES